MSSRHSSNMYSVQFRKAFVHDDRGPHSSELRHWARVMSGITKEKYPANRPKQIRARAWFTKKKPWHDPGRSPVLTTSGIKLRGIYASFIPSCLTPRINIDNVFRARIAFRTYHSSGILQIPWHLTQSQSVVEYNSATPKNVTIAEKIRLMRWSCRHYFYNCVRFTARKFDPMR